MSLPRSISIGLSALILCLASPLASRGQDDAVTLRGFVTDAETGRPLIGANVTLQPLDAPGASPSGAATGEQGYYQVVNLAVRSYLFRVSFVGYEAAEDTLRLGGQEGLVTRSVGLVPAEEALEEVEVSAERGGPAELEAGRQTIRPEDIRRIPTPVVGGDLAMYLQSLPGVVAIGDRGGQLFIRGGSPSQNLVLLDGTPIYQPFHIVGFFSAFPQELISSVDFYAGGFPASYTGRLSSVIDVEMRGGNQEQYGGAVSVSPLAATARVEGPVERGRSSFLVSARRSLVERVASRVIGEDQPIYFEDQFIKYQRVSELSRCSVSGLHTYDRGRIDPAVRSVFRWSNYAATGRCIVAPQEASLLADVRGGVSAVTNGVGTPGGADRTSSTWRIHNAVDLTYVGADGSELRGGLRMHADQMNHELREWFVGLRRDGDFLVTASGYVGATIAPWNRGLRLEPSVSVTLPSTYAPGVEPRLRAHWQPWGSEAQQFSAAVGLYQQLIEGISDERDAGTVFTAWMPTPVRERRANALHTIIGWHQRHGSFGWAAEAYYKNLSALPVPVWSNYARFTTELDLAEGDVYGFDLRLEYDRAPLTAYVGYGWSWTRYALEDQLLGEALGNPVQTYHPPHDRRHSFNAAVYADMDWITTSVRWEIGSGLPFTRLQGFDSFFDLREYPDVRTGYGTPRFMFDKPYQGRLPAYHRLDVSLERTFSMGVVDLTAKAGAINAYDRSNLFYFDLFTFRRVDQLPLVPFFAVEVSTR